MNTVCQSLSNLGIIFISTVTTKTGWGWSVLSLKCYSGLLRFTNHTVCFLAQFPNRSMITNLSRKMQLTDENSEIDFDSVGVAVIVIGEDRTQGE